MSREQTGWGRGVRVKGEVGRCQEKQRNQKCFPTDKQHRVTNGNHGSEACETQQAVGTDMGERRPRDKEVII